MILKNTRIIIIDDEEPFRKAIGQYLVEKGAIVKEAENLASARSQISEFDPQVMLLDKQLQSEDGFSLIREVRRNEQFKTLSILVLTGSSCFEEQLEAFHQGADDLLVKPIELPELEARIIANKRRSASYLSSEQEASCGPIQINLVKQEVTVSDKSIDLTETEFKILKELVLRQGQLIHRETLSARTLSTPNTGAKTINVHMTSLRKKLGEDAAKHIQTIRGRGFKLVCED